MHFRVEITIICWKERIPLNRSCSCSLNKQRNNVFVEYFIHFLSKFRARSECFNDSRLFLFVLGLFYCIELLYKIVLMILATHNSLIIISSNKQPVQYSLKQCYNGTFPNWRLSLSLKVSNNKFIQYPISRTGLKVNG